MVIGYRDECFLLPLPLPTQAIRVLGLLGALDPYKHKVNIGMIDQSRDASAVSLSESKSSQDSCKLRGLVRDLPHSASRSACRLCLERALGWLTNDSTSAHFMTFEWKVEFCLKPQ